MNNRDLKIDGAVLICMNKKSFLKCGNCNNRLKLILVTCEQFCLAKRCPICYKMDFSKHFSRRSIHCRCSRNVIMLGLTL